ncbi:MAG: DUF4440 domain-containing protein [Sphingobacteriales bacterium]|nr:MAG: DUF4440 domain-containing protein [Sphingobacteriales bacterium]
MKQYLLMIFANACTIILYSQDTRLADNHSAKLKILIDKYSEARENRDTMLLKLILTADVDQLVSTGEWRTGIDASVRGMLNSSASSPGTRTLIVDRIRMLSATNAIVDCRYEIQNADGSPRKMWSTFLTVYEKTGWKIAAIRNMMPVKQ